MDLHPAYRPSLRDLWRCGLFVAAFALALAQVVALSSWGFLPGWCSLAASSAAGGVVLLTAFWFNAAARLESGCNLVIAAVVLTALILWLAPLSLKLAALVGAGPPLFFIVSAATSIGDLRQVTFDRLHARAGADEAEGRALFRCQRQTTFGTLLLLPDGLRFQPDLSRHLPEQVQVADLRAASVAPGSLLDQLLFNGSTRLVVDHAQGQLTLRGIGAPAIAALLRETFGLPEVSPA